MFSTTSSTDFSMPRFSASGLAPAATFFRPWRTIACAGHVVGRRGDLAHELGALVLEDVLDLDLASDRDAVVGDGRRAELLVEDHVAALRAERDLDRVGDGVDACLQRTACIRVVLELLVCHV
jgi:hypothetical protein